jgi:alpha-ketoglutarate-dependent taurine dioxygenase
MSPEHSIVKLDLSGTRGFWSREGTAIQATLAEHCGGDVPGNQLVESNDPATLRAKLQIAAPLLTALTYRVRDAFAHGEACAIIINAMGLVRFSDDERRKAMYAFSALLGDPLANHPDNAVIWDVRDRGPESSAGVSHSTSSRAAGYHTDAGYLKNPPEFFLLYAIKAAACGGGESLIRDGRTVLRQLSQCDEGRAAIKTLSRAFPRRVAGKFHPVADIAQDGFQYAPILAEAPLWRWARKNIRLGLEHNPAYASQDAMQALATLGNQLQYGPGELRPKVPTDGVLIVNNHVALHGRTAFVDTDRHLLRIRWREATSK